jgi:hypothetical protein
MVDVITNSSSELFVCETDKTPEAVEKMLRDLLGLFNKQSASSYSFSGCFKKPYLISATALVADNYYCQDNYWIKKLAEDKKEVLVIESTSDNTIPYSLFDWIEEVFNGHREHMG